MSQNGSSSISRPATSHSHVSSHVTPAPALPSARPSPSGPGPAPAGPGSALAGPAYSLSCGGGDPILAPSSSVDLLARGGTVYTGPDGQRPYRMKVAHPDYQFIGEGTRSPEDTSGVAYLFRPSKDTPFPRARGSHIGEIGWMAS